MIFIFPTELESAPFRAVAPHADIRVCGVGLAACAAAVSEIIATTSRYEVLVLCGIAGSYDAADVSVGEVVEVASEMIEELPEHFAERYTTEPFTSLRSASSNSVSSSHAASRGAQIENMEGASFMALCRVHSRRGVQIRAISNVVGEPFALWRVDEALNALTDRLFEMINDK